MPARYGESVFINCPFDETYSPIFNGIVFAVYDCGLVARCALELSGGIQNRLDKIYGIIEECRYGIHDISRTEPGKYRLPRFNMPLELGIFLAAQRFGTGRQHQKACLVLDRRPYRYQRFISDIAGQEVASHENRPGRAIRAVRDWLRTESGRTTIPGGQEVAGRFRRFRRDLPDICGELRIRPEELTFVDYTHVVEEWLKAKAT